MLVFLNLLREGRLDFTWVSLAIKYRFGYFSCKFDVQLVHNSYSLGLVCNAYVVRICPLAYFNALDFAHNPFVLAFVVDNKHHVAHAQFWVVWCKKWFWWRLA